MLSLWLAAALATAAAAAPTPIDARVKPFGPDDGVLYAGEELQIVLTLSAPRETDIPAFAASPPRPDVSGFSPTAEPYLSKEPKPSPGGLLLELTWRGTFASSGDKTIRWPGADWAKDVKIRAATGCLTRGSYILGRRARGEPSRRLSGACLGGRRALMYSCSSGGLATETEVDCERGCRDKACRPTKPEDFDGSSKALALLRPNGGDVLHPGARLRVDWISKNARRVELAAKTSGGILRLAALDDPGQSKARLSTQLVALPSTLPSGDATLILRAAGGISDESFEPVTIAPIPKEELAAREAFTGGSDVDVPAYHASPRPDDVALVIGIERYSGLPPALYAERDAAAMRAHLSALGFPDDRLRVLTGRRATRAALDAAVDGWLPSVVKPGSLVFVYFAGHGAPDAGAGAAYLVPWDGDPAFLEKTSYPLSRLSAKLAALKARSAFLVLDACFSGTGGRSVFARGSRPLVQAVDLELSSKVTTLAAAAADQISGVSENQGHGLLTYHFLKGLAGGAAHGGDMTAQDVYAYTRRRVEEEAARDNRTQTPQLRGDGASILLRRL